MSDYNEKDHPRGQLGNAGQFREKTNSAPAAALTLGTDYDQQDCPSCGFYGTVPREITSIEPYAYEWECPECGDVFDYIDEEEGDSASALISELPVGARFTLQTKQSERISDRELATTVTAEEIVTLIGHGGSHETILHADGRIDTVPDHRVWLAI